MIKKLGIILSIFMCFININAFACTESAQIQDRIINKKEKYIEIKIKTPIIKTNSKIGDDITSKIDSDTEKWVNDVREIAESDYNSNNMIYEAMGIYDLHYNKNCFLSITMTNYQFTGGAHGMTFKVPYNFDLKTGKALKLSDLFKDDYDYKKVIDATIREEIVKHKEYYFNDGADFKGISGNQDFYITNKGIFVYFSLYEIAPYSSGIREFFISNDSLKNGFKLEIYQ